MNAPLISELKRKEYYECIGCRRIFYRKFNLKRHIIKNKTDGTERLRCESKIKGNLNQCANCYKIFANKSNCKRHIKNCLTRHCPSKEANQCPKCSKNFIKNANLLRHIEKCETTQEKGKRQNRCVVCIKDGTKEGPNLFRIPTKDEQKSKLWTQFFERRNIFLSKRSFICCNHFEKTDIYGRNSWKRLTPKAIPYDKTLQVISKNNSHLSNHLNLISAQAQLVFEQDNFLHHSNKLTNTPIHDAHSTNPELTYLKKIKCLKEEVHLLRRKIKRLKKKRIPQNKLNEIESLKRENQILKQKLLWQNKVTKNLKELLIK